MHIPFICLMNTLRFLSKLTPFLMAVILVYFLFVNKVLCVAPKNVISCRFYIFS